jgi:hypothetical protein
LDLNFHFIEQENGSDITCSETYAGPAVFSENESMAMRDYIVSVVSSLDAFFALHSYSQFILLPYANTTDHLGNYDDLKQIGTKGVEAIYNRTGTEYIIGNSAEILCKKMLFDETIRPCNIFFK